jgi:hypothetical protein
LTPLSSVLIFIIINTNADIGADHPSSNGQFKTTHWSFVLLAGQSQTTKGEAALEELCRTYWYPLYAYVRRKGHSAHDAQDLTQDFSRGCWKKTVSNGRWRSGAGSGPFS